MGVLTDAVAGPRREGHVGVGVSLRHGLLGEAVRVKVVGVLAPHLWPLEKRERTRGFLCKISGQMAKEAPLGT